MNLKEKEKIIEKREENMILKNNDFKIIVHEKIITDEDIKKRMIYARVMKRKKMMRLEAEVRKIKMIINQIQAELRAAMDENKDREIDRLMEVRGYYLRDLKNIEKELSKI